MKLSIRALSVIIIATLSGGLALGWFIFGGDEKSEHSHTEMINNESVWTCSMHPQIRQNEPGSCPICGMDLVPVEYSAGSDMDPLAIAMSQTAMTLASISTSEVTGEGVSKIIRLNGKVQEDERRVYSQTVHFPGRIESLSINFTGEYMRKGSKIADIYSPQLVTAQEELLEAFKIRDTQPNLYRAAQEKLKNWKLSQNQIDQIIGSGEVREKFAIHADYSGYVLKKNINLGDHVMEGQSIYEIADLSWIWVLFDIYESDMPWVKKGDSVQFTISSIPGRRFEGKVDFIDPVVNPATRVTQARVVVSNDMTLLKPEMFASGELKAKVNLTDGQTTVPKSAVMWTGKRSVVYVKLLTDQGLYFKMREVILGPALGDSYVVEEGLEVGEIIAVNGAFSIDAAAQLAGKPSMMSPEGGASSGGHNHGESSGDRSQHPIELKVNEFVQPFQSDPRFREQLKAIFLAYLPLKDALIQSDAEQAGKEANHLHNTLEKVDMRLVAGEAHEQWMKDLSVLQKATNSIAGSAEVEHARAMLSPLSDQLYHSLKKFQVQVDGYRQYCPMAFDFEGAFWLSDSDEILNPYFGDAMLTCGNVEEELN